MVLYVNFDNIFHQRSWR